jgi:hypothetical protein
MVSRMLAALLAVSVVACSRPPPDHATIYDTDLVCFDDGTCATCTDDDSCTLCDPDGTCADCNDFWEIGGDPVPTVETNAAFATAPPPPTYIVEILADGTGVIMDEAGNVLQKIPRLATKVGGQWVIKPENVPKELNGARIIARVAKCFGPIGGLLLIAGLSYAGMDIALGDAAAKMGVRLKDCQDSFATVVKGITCLVYLPWATKCTDAVKACPDAIFGANLTMTCGAEPTFPALVDALAAALAGTANRPGGAGSVKPDIAHLIQDAIKNGTFASDTSKVCTMQASISNCTFVDGSIFPPPAGYTEAKNCWNNASRGIVTSKWEEAISCCTTDACRSILASFKDC